MKRTLTTLLGVAALGAAPMAANALTYSFNASLGGANEVPGNAATATGLATLVYDTHDTASLLDDTFDFAMAAFGLSGGTVAGTAASAWHIHGAASPAEIAPVRVALDSTPPFVALNSGSTLLVGGDDVAVPATIPATPADANNAGYPEMSFLDMLRGGLAYVNIHTAANPGGEIRGQLVEVSAVPEPSSYALAIAGLGVVGLMAWRRRRDQQDG